MKPRALARLTTRRNAQPNTAKNQPAAPNQLGNTAPPRIVTRNTRVPNYRATHTSPQATTTTKTATSTTY